MNKQLSDRHCVVVVAARSCHWKAEELQELAFSTDRPIMLRMHVLTHTEKLHDFMTK